MTVRYGARTPLRRDAQRNRAAILEAANEAMTTPREAIDMPEIARRAGVGQATLYRHFPDRLALTTAVIAMQMDRLEACVATTVRQPARLRHILDAVLRTQVSMRPLVLLARRLEPGVQAGFVRRLITALSGPLRIAQDQGYVRRDLRPADLMLLMTMVEGVVAEDPAAADLSIRIALDGIFSEGGPVGRICSEHSFSDSCGEPGRAEGPAVVGHHG